MTLPPTAATKSATKHKSTFRGNRRGGVNATFAVSQERLLFWPLFKHDRRVAIAEESRQPKEHIFYQNRGLNYGARYNAKFLLVQVV
jgi:hypothetical protein